MAEPGALAVLWTLGVIMVAGGVGAGLAWALDTWRERRGRRR